MSSEEFEKMMNENYMNALKKFCNWYNKELPPLNLESNFIDVAVFLNSFEKFDNELNNLKKFSPDYHAALITKIEDIENTLKNYDESEPLYHYVIGYVYYNTVNLTQIKINYIKELFKDNLKGEYIVNDKILNDIAKGVIYAYKLPDLKKELNDLTNGIAPITTNKSDNSKMRNRNNTVFTTVFETFNSVDSVLWDSYMRYIGNCFKENELFENVAVINLNDLSQKLRFDKVLNKEISTNLSLMKGIEEKKSYFSYLLKEVREYEKRAWSLYNVLDTFPKNEIILEDSTIELCEIKGCLNVFYNCIIDIKGIIEDELKNENETISSINKLITQLDNEQPNDLTNRISLPTTEPETIPNTTPQKKIKWTGTPGEFGAIFNELIDNGFINTVKDKKNMVRQLHEMFEVTNDKGNNVSLDYLYKCFKDKIKPYPPNTLKVPYSDNYNKNK